MDRLALSAGVARRTLYNQFTGKEAVFQAVVERQWALIGNDWLSKVGPDSDPRQVLLRVGELVVRLVTRPDHVALARMVIAESRRFPKLAEDFHRYGKQESVELLTRYVERMSAEGVFGCPWPVLAAYQFLGMIHELVLWPKVMAHRAELDVPPATVIVEEAVTMFLSRYSTARPISRK